MEAANKNEGSWILVTGGCGYIGSHTVLQLLRAGEKVVVIDNLSNSSDEALRRVEQLAGKKVDFIEIDVLDKPKLEEVFRRYTVRTVIHFAGLKAVGESVSAPLQYYHANVVGAFILMDVMDRAGVRNLVFSSSATVYGCPDANPIPETASLRCTNPYGRTKLFVEEIAKDLCKSNASWSVALLRYFNPCGSDESGRIGEDPRNIPNNLMPYVAQVASGLRERVRVFGNDYETADGTGVRDYLHVVDLAAGHLAAVKKVERSKGCNEYNLGCGAGHSVLDMIAEFEKICGKKIPYEIVERRPGDVAEVVADPSKANRELNWKAAKGITEMCTDMWRWQKANPHGYGKPI